jgi:hypothetical protein
MTVPAADDDGPWVPGFPDDSNEFAAWIEGETPPPHHVKWNEAIQRGLDHKTREWSNGDRDMFVLEFQVVVRKKNPGWIDGYRVVARP